MSRETRASHFSSNCPLVALAPFYCSPSPQSTQTSRLSRTGNGQCPVPAREQIHTARMTRIAQLSRPCRGIAREVLCVLTAVSTPSSSLLRHTDHSLVSRGRGLPVGSWEGGVFACLETFGSVVTVVAGRTWFLFTADFASAKM